METTTATSLFEPDALLPSQFFTTFRGGAAAAGERRLMLAILADAVECYQKYAFARSRPGRRLFVESAEWIGAQDRKTPFSFLNICDTLAIDPEYVRGGLARWRTQGDPGRLHLATRRRRRPTRSH